MDLVVMYANADELIGRQTTHGRLHIVDYTWSTHMVDTYGRLHMVDCKVCWGRNLTFNLS